MSGPAFEQCRKCGGDGCQRCHGTGKIRLTTVPELLEIMDITQAEWDELGKDKTPLDTSWIE